MSLATRGPWRVWLVTDVYPPDCGGSGWSTHALALALLDAGHDVEVIGLDPSSWLCGQRTYEAVRITEIGTAPARRSPARRLGARDYAHARVFRFLAARLEREPEVDILHAQHLHSGPPALEAARAAGRAAVLTLRDYWPVCLHGTTWLNGESCPGCTPGRAPERRDGARRLRGCMREYWGWPGLLTQAMVPWARRRLTTRRRGALAAHRIVAVSEAVGRVVAADLAAGDLRVVPNIVDEQRAVEEADAAARGSAIPDPPYLVTAGKLTHTKGFDRLLEALAEAEVSWPLIVAGSGPERVALEHLAAKLDLAVSFTGWIPHDRVLALVRGAQALLLPSRWAEPLSRLLLEAMVLGTPVIAWPTGGSPEAIQDGVNGALVSTAARLGESLRQLGQPEVRERMGKAARDTARARFAPEVVRARIEDIYAQALVAAGRSAAADGGTASAGSAHASPPHGDAR